MKQFLLNRNVSIKFVIIVTNLNIFLFAFIIILLINLILLFNSILLFLIQAVLKIGFYLTKIKIMQILRDYLIKIEIM